MNFTVAKRMQDLPKQFFSSLVGRVQNRIEQGYDVINLGQGNPDLPTPHHIVEALREAALDPSTHRYPPFRGLLSLKEAVSAFYLREYDVQLDPETEVAILFGGKAGLVELSEIYLNPGDIALVPDPGYPDYWSGISLSGGRMVSMPLLAENRFLPDLSAIHPMDANQAKLMFLNYPNNPTGAIADAQFFAEVAEFAEKFGILVVHDFAYGAIGFDGIKPPSFLQTPHGKEVGVEIYTLSKTFNMAGWRVAFAVGHSDVISQINLLQDHYYVSLFAAVQRAGIAALTGSMDVVNQLCQTYEARRDGFVSEFSKYGLTYSASQGTFFCWLPTPKGFTSTDFADYLLYQANVAVAPGIGFGEKGEGFVRIGLLTGESRLREAAKRMSQAILEYKD